MQLNYLQGYPDKVLQQVTNLLEQNKLGQVLQQRYAKDSHAIQTDASLYRYTQELKQQYMRSSPPVSKVVFDSRIHIIDNALGQHHFISRVQGAKLKSKNEIKIAAVLKTLPEPLLRMLVVHELAHLKEKSHNKAFYQLCQHMEPNYHQLELDLRLFLTWRDWQQQATDLALQ